MQRWCVRDATACYECNDDTQQNPSQWRKSEADILGGGGGGGTLFVFGPPPASRVAQRASPKKRLMRMSGGGGGGDSGTPTQFSRHRSRGTHRTSLTFLRSKREKKVNNVREHLKRGLISICNHPTQKRGGGRTYYVPHLPKSRGGHVPLSPPLDLRPWSGLTSTNANLESTLDRETLSPSHRVCIPCIWKFLVRYIVTGCIFCAASGLRQGQVPPPPSGTLYPVQSECPPPPFRRFVIPKIRYSEYTIFVHLHEGSLIRILE